jgi:hypothetical protein
LPPAILYKLSAQSAPADVVAAVVAASTTETPMQVQEIAERLDTAREEEKEIQQEIARAKGALSREEAKAQRAKRKVDRAATEAAWKRKEAKRRDEEDAARQRKVGREERITPAIEFIARSLRGEDLLDLVDLLKDMSGHYFIISILSAEQNSRIPPPEDTPIVPTIDPTDWQNKRDYCLTHTAGLTGTQQDFVAALHGNPSAEQLAKLEHIHAICTRVQT